MGMIRNYELVIAFYPSGRVDMPLLEILHPSDEVLHKSQFVKREYAIEMQTSSPGA